MFGILANSEQLSVMKLTLVVLCVAAVLFLMRVLVALVKETRSPATTLKAYHAAFHPLRKRGELIRMNPDAMTQRYASNGQRIALVLLLYLGVSEIVFRFATFLKF